MYIHTHFSICITLQFWVIFFGFYKKQHSFSFVFFYSGFCACQKSRYAILQADMLSTVQRVKFKINVFRQNGAIPFCVSIH